jgi:hypothetical protein
VGRYAGEHAHLAGGSVTTTVTLLKFRYRLFATFLRLAVGAPGFASGGAFWVAPGAGGMPGPRAALPALASERTAAAGSATGSAGSNRGNRTNSATPASPMTTAAAVATTLGRRSLITFMPSLRR